MTHICLTMIVKNEAKILPRCIAAVRPFIDSYAIVDTGSTDDTIAVAKRELSGMRGRVVSLPEWKGFGHARTRALKMAEDVGDWSDNAYSLTVDADDIWTGTKPELDGKLAYAVWFTRPGGRFATSRLLRFNSGIVYEGVVHEMPVLKSGEPLVGQLIEDMTVTSPNDGASWSNPNKNLEHAQAIHRAMVDDPTNHRYAFYLAQSYRDHGDDEKAYRLYLARAAMGLGSEPEQVYCSYLEAGRALWRLGRLDEAKHVLWKAHAACPERREAMAEIARLFAVKCATSPTVGTLFVETWFDQPEAAE